MTPEHKVLTKNTHSPSEPAPISGLDEVDESLHDDVRLALSVLDVQQELEAGEDVGVVVDVVHRHDGNRAQLWR